MGGYEVSATVATVVERVLMIKEREDGAKPVVGRHEGSPSCKGMSVNGGPDRPSRHAITASGVMVSGYAHPNMYLRVRRSRRKKGTRKKST